MIKPGAGKGCIGSDKTPGNLRASIGEVKQGIEKRKVKKNRQRAEGNHRAAGQPEGGEEQREWRERED